MKRYVLMIWIIVVPFVWAKEPVVTETQEDIAAQLPLEELRLFTAVFDRIRLNYVEEIDDKTLLENAMRGMLSELDPHSSYLDSNSFDDLQTYTHGEFGGLGIEVGMQDGFVEVIAPIDDTPAFRAGIQSGDLIIKLDDTSVQGMTLGEAVDEMRGVIGEPIVLTIMRQGIEQPFEVKLVRDVIKVRSVKVDLPEPGYGYVRVAQFQLKTGEELQKKIQQLVEDDPLKGLVLDLRNNPGGVLQAAVEVADLFIDEGLIVYTEGRMSDANVEYAAQKNKKPVTYPIVVLVNGGSASASEIVAGALQDHGRAIIMGTDTFGKGSVQTVMPVSENTAIKLTTALYYTPNGRSIQAEGIKPDIYVERAQLTAVSSGELYTAEADLKGHIDNVQSDHKEQTRSHDVELLYEDNQLYEALHVLKAIYLTRDKNQQ